MSLQYDNLKILALIYKYKDPVFAYDLYKDLRMIYKDYILIINSLISKNYIVENGNSLEITSIGVNLLLKEKNNYYTTGSKIWKDVPKKFKRNVLDSDSYYIPSRMKLDIGHFTKK